MRNQYVEFERAACGPYIHHHCLHHHDYHYQYHNYHYNSIPATTTTTASTQTKLSSTITTIYTPTNRSTNLPTWRYFPCPSVLFMQRVNAEPCVHMCMQRPQRPAVPCTQHCRRRSSGRPLLHEGTG